MRRLGALLTLVLLMLLVACGKKQQPVSFREHIQPILQTRCGGCHGDKTAAGNIVLTSYENVMASRTVKAKKPLVVPENLAESWLYVLAGTDQPHFRMPPDTSHFSPVPEEDVKLVGEWIMQGAKNN